VVSIEVLEVIAASTRAGNEGTAKAAQELLRQAGEIKLRAH